MTFAAKRGRDAHVFPRLDTAKAAGIYREHLLLADVDRSELHARSDVRRPIRLHDARATMFTRPPLPGEACMQDRSDHTCSIAIGAKHGLRLKSASAN